MDWLKPVVVVDTYFLRNVLVCFRTAALSPQVQLAMNPYNAYKKILIMRTKEGQSLLHVAAENGNEKIVHLFLLLGAKNVQDVKKRLPYQCAQEKGEHRLAQFIMDFFELQGLDGILNDVDEGLLKTHINWFIKDEIRFIGVEVFPEIQESQNNNSQQNKSMIGEKKKNRNRLQGISKDEKNLNKNEGAQKYRELVEETLKDRFFEYHRVYTDGSIKIKKEDVPTKKGKQKANEIIASTENVEQRSKTVEVSGAAYYNENSNEGVGYPIQPAADIHSAELIAIKIALEEVTCDNDIVVLTDRQPVAKMLENIVKDADKCNVKSILLNYIILFRLKYPPNPYVKAGLQWIRAHVGIEGNEVADELANKARIEGKCVLSEEVVGDVRNRLKKEKENLEKIKGKRQIKQK